MVLDGASFTVTVPEEDELMLLTGPERADTLTVYLKKRRGE